MSTARAAHSILKILAWIGVPIVALAATVYPYFPPPGITYTPAGGMALGTPTGGVQGANTVNAAGVFVNGVAVSTGAAPTLVFKPADTSRATTAPTPDPDLVFAGVAAGNHTVTCLIIWTSTATSINLRYGLAASGTITVAELSGINSNSGGIGGATAAAIINGNSSFSNGGIATIGTGGIESAVILHAMLVTSTSGTVQFGWAQQSTSATAVTVQQGSWCQLT